MCHVVPNLHTTMLSHHKTENPKIDDNMNKVDDNNIHIKDTLFHKKTLD